MFYKIAYALQDCLIALQDCLRTFFILQPTGRTPEPVGAVDSLNLTISKKQKQKHNTESSSTGKGADCPLGLHFCLRCHRLVPVNPTSFATYFDKPEEGDQVGSVNPDTENEDIDSNAKKLRFP